MFMFIMVALLWLMSSILFLEILKTNKLYRQVLLWRDRSFTRKRDKTAKVGITLGWDVYIDRPLFHSIRYVDFCNSLFRCHL